MNRRLAIHILLASLAVPLSLADSGDTSGRKPAYTGATARGAAPAPRILRTRLDAASTRFIVEFTAQPLARLAPAARASSSHRALFQRFRDDLAAIDTAASDTKSAASTIEHEYSVAFSGAAVTVRGESVDAIRRLPYVKRVVPDGEVRGSVEPNIAAVGADRVWSNFGTQGAGVTVAIIDSGIDYMHPALGGGIGPGFKVLGGHDFVNDDSDPMDDNGHGTHVAGIVAANSDAILGVAPEANLIAFKVLDAARRGVESNVLAAIERCADPNGDSDFSDRVQVVNMSLGGEGAPDDPQSTAVNAASDLGIVFAIAAGNEGAWESIDSPGTAAKAITVGASDGTDTVAGFSSRGPVAPAYVIKPDVVAPGVGIRSTWPGGGTFVLSGTSMATPHVAGIAALVRAIHPLWSSDDVKSAIVNSAQPLHTSVMAAGAGFPDAERAVAASTLVAPAAIDFGVVDRSLDRWVSRRSFLVRNESDESRDVIARTTGGRAGLTLLVNTPSFTLQPGESRELTVSARVDNQLLDSPLDGSLSFGGTLTIDNGLEVVRVPWAVVKGLSLSVEWTGNENVVAILGADNGRSVYVTVVSETSFSKLVAPGIYNLGLIAIANDGGPTSFIAFENIVVEADHEVVASRLNAQYTLDFNATDEHGTPVESSPDLLPGCVRTRSVLLPGSPRRLIELQLGDSTGFRSSRLSPQFVVLAADYCVDAARERIYGIHFQPIRGVTSSRFLEAGGADLLPQRVDVRIPLAGVDTASLLTEAILTASGQPLPIQMAADVSLKGPQWSGTLFLSSQRDPDFDFPVRLTTVASFNGAEAGSIASPLIHRDDEGVACFDSETPPPTAYTAAPGERLVFGGGTTFPVIAVGPGTSPTVTLDFFGALDERVSSVSASMSLYGRDGALLASGRDTLTIPDILAKPRILAQTDSQQVGGMASMTIASSTTGATVDDPYPPTLTSMILLSENGSRLVDSAPRGSSPRVRLSAVDGNDDTVQGRVRFRPTGTATWTDVPIAVVGYDRPGEAIGHPPRGTIFEASLAALAAANGTYDLWLILEDDAGNEMSIQFIPALSIYSGRKHPVRPN